MTKPSNTSLSVPNIPELDDMSLDQVARVLESKGARRTIDCVNWPDQFPYHPLTTFSIAHSGKYIYIDFFVRCNYLRAVNSENNSHVHQDSCVEFFVQPGEGQPYRNFEFNCIGTIHAARRQDRHSGQLMTDEELDRVKRLPSCGTRPFNEIEGLFTWNLTVAIPLDLVGVEYKGKPIELKGNFYKCADLTADPHFLTWAPVNTPEPDFHRPEFFVPITLE